MNTSIDAMQVQDWAAVAAIYREGIASGLATFETTVPDWETWDSAHRPECRLIARHDGRVVGWAALTPVSKRAVYDGVAEVSVYVAEQARGQGVGGQLLTALVAASELEGIWMLQASIFPENSASVALHKTCGFRVVGYRERIARLHDEWRNTILMERRSAVTGV
jgi:L-amino acid N-acyltransferase YncA